MSVNDPLLTVKTVAERLGVGVMTVYRLIEDGELYSLRVRNQFRIPLSALRQYLADAEYVPGGAA